MLLVLLCRCVMAAGGETPSGPAAKRQRADGGAATPGSDAWDHGHVALTPASGSRATASESAKSAARVRGQEWGCARSVEMRLRESECLTRIHPRSLLTEQAGEH